MADRRVKKRKADKTAREEEKEELSKLQKKVVNWLRKAVPTKKTKFEHSHVVEYFNAGKALDALMKDSPWAPEKAKDGAELKFEFREQAIDYVGELMRLHMFHRARKVAVAEKDKKKKKEETDEEEEETKTKKSLKEDKTKVCHYYYSTTSVVRSYLFVLSERKGEREEEEKDKTGDALRPSVPGR